jgi:hypothetical protein
MRNCARDTHGLIRFDHCLCCPPHKELSKKLDEDSNGVSQIASALYHAVPSKAPGTATVKGVIVASALESE